MRLNRPWRLLYALPLLFLAVFYFYPLLSILGVSLAPGGRLDLSGVQALATRPYLAEVLWFTLWQAAASTALTLLLGLPAAYVSGYIRTIPPEGQPRLAGADASHAWVSVWCGPAFGWIDCDPTNACLVGDDHIVVAIGRDYADVSPVEGVLLGSAGTAKQNMTFGVDVVPV